MTAIVHTDGTGAERLELVIRAQLRAMAQHYGQRYAVHSSANWDERPACTIAEMINTAYQQPAEALLIERARDGSNQQSPMHDRRPLRCSARSPSMHSCTWSPGTTSTRRWSPAPSAPSCSTACARGRPVASTTACRFSARI